MSAGHRTYYDTYLDRWMAANGVKPAHLARESGYCRQHVLRLRRGDMEPTRRCIKAITAACLRLSAKPVKASDLFDLGD
jgi:predicted transcriptional regulator